MDVAVRIPNRATLSINELVVASLIDRFPTCHRTLALVSINAFNFIALQLPTNASSPLLVSSLFLCFRPSDSKVYLPSLNVMLPTDQPLDHFASTTFIEAEIGATAIRINHSPHLNRDCSQYEKYAIVHLFVLHYFREVLCKSITDSL